jgi:hypothetical protein
LVNLLQRQIRAEFERFYAKDPGTERITRIKSRFLKQPSPGLDGLKSTAT